MGRDSRPVHILRSEVPDECRQQPRLPLPDGASLINEEKEEEVVFTDLSPSVNSPGRSRRVGIAFFRLIKIFLSRIIRRTTSSSEIFCGLMVKGTPGSNMNLES